MWRHDRLDRFELFGGIAACIDFRARQGGMSQPEGYLADILRGLQHDHRAGVPQDVWRNPLVLQSRTKLTSRFDMLFQYVSKPPTAQRFTSMTDEHLRRRNSLPNREPGSERRRCGFP